jgi:hypothetical protein
MTKIEQALRYAIASAPKIIVRILTFAHFWTRFALQASRSS